MKPCRPRDENRLYSFFPQHLRAKNKNDFFVASAVVSELANAIEDEVDDLLANRVVAAGEVVRRVLLAADELLRVEQLTVRARAHLVDHGRLEVHEDRARHVLARARLAEERVERIVAAANRLVRGHLTVRLDAVLEAEELPARVTDLETGLADLRRELA